MSIVTLSEAKLHCRVDHNDEDTLIQLYLDAAELSVANFLDRNVYASTIAQGTDTAGIVINAPIKSAILLLVGHYYANREATTMNVTTLNVVEAPMAVRWLLMPYRATLGV